MKKHLFILLILISVAATAQPQLWGTMQAGGVAGIGTIFHIYGDGTGYAAASGFNGGSPQCQLTPFNGFLYGLSASGGPGYFGDVFKFNAVTGVYTSLAAFTDTATGKYPRGSLFLASDGKMYGTAEDGGNTDYGTFFSFDPASNQLVKIIDFTGPNGRNPQEDLVEYNGKLYGTTAAGGANSFGEIFSYELSSGNFTVVHNFNFTDGMAPYGSLIVWNSLLYGTTFVGGANGAGTIFSFDPQNPGSVTTLHNFNVADGSAPMGTLMFAGNSLMYGTASQGGDSSVGVLFSFNSSGNIYTKLHDFGGSDGQSPEGALIQASDGNLYGTTSSGGINDVGSLFRYNIGSSQFTKIYDCALVTGYLPDAALLEYNAATGLPDLTKNNKLKIRSNPVSEQLNVKLEGSGDAFTVQIFSVEGKVLKSWSKIALQDEHSFVTGDLSPGTYFIYVTSEKEEFISQFIKK
jgi:uncharacterized repeat protein (TIGR03803 family)